MIAIARKMNPDGSTNVETSGNHITRNYQSLKTLVRYGLLTLPAGKYEVEVYANRDKIYGQPMKSFVQNVRAK